MDERALVGLVGLAMRAGQLLLGTGRVVDQLRAGTNLVVLMDSQVASNTHKRVGDACSAHQCPLYLLPGGFLESALGRPGAMVAGLKPGGIREKIVTVCCVDNN